METYENISATMSDIVKDTKGKATERDGEGKRKREKEGEKVSEEVIACSSKKTKKPKAPNS